MRLGTSIGTRILVEKYPALREVTFYERLHIPYEDAIKIKERLSSLGFELI